MLSHNSPAPNDVKPSTATPPPTTHRSTATNAENALRIKQLFDQLLRERDNLREEVKTVGRRSRKKSIVPYEVEGEEDSEATIVQLNTRLYELQRCLEESRRENKAQRVEMEVLTAERDAALALCKSVKVVREVNEACKETMDLADSMSTIWEATMPTTMTGQTMDEEEKEDQPLAQTSVSPSPFDSPSTTISPLPSGIAPSSPVPTTNTPPPCPPHRPPPVLTQLMPSSNKPDSAMKPMKDDKTENKSDNPSASGRHAQNFERRRSTSNSQRGGHWHKSGHGPPTNHYKRNQWNREWRHPYGGRGQQDDHYNHRRHLPSIDRSPLRPRRRTQTDGHHERRPSRSRSPRTNFVAMGRSNNGSSSELVSISSASETSASELVSISSESSASPPAMQTEKDKLSTPRWAVRSESNSSGGNGK